MLTLQPCFAFKILTNFFTCNILCSSNLSNIVEISSWMRPSNADDILLWQTVEGTYVCLGHMLLERVF